MHPTPLPRRALAVGALIAAAAALPLAARADTGGTPPSSAGTSAGPGWTVPPQLRDGEGFRVREGVVGDPETLLEDRATAAQGLVVGALPALEAAGAAGAASRAAGGADAARLRSGGSGHHPLYGPDTYAEEVWVADVGALLSDDRDGDGFFGAFALSVDVDTGGISREIYLGIDLLNDDGSLALSHDTLPYTVRGAALSDEYRIEIELLENHPEGYRDVSIQVRAAYDGALLDAVSAHELTILSGLPLESERPRDDFDDGYAFGAGVDGHGGYVNGVAYRSEGHVAGYAAASGPGTALALAALVLVRWRRRTL